jgi:hypothetical protein
MPPPLAIMASNVVRLGIAIFHKSSHFTTTIPQIMAGQTLVADVLSKRFRVVQCESSDMIDPVLESLH